MKKTTQKKNRSARRTQMAVAATATIMAVPMLGMPAKGMAQTAGPLGGPAGGPTPSNDAMKVYKFFDTAHKIAGTYTIAGIDNKHVVFQKSNGELFFLDQSGNMQLLSALTFSREKLKGTSKTQGTSASGIKSLDATWLKDHRVDGNVTLLGEDASGRDLVKTNRGETVYLNPTTGDFVPVVLK